MPQTGRLIIALSLISTCLPAADLAKQGDRWWSRIEVIADDKMEGRNTGSAGYLRAAQYVAGEFERAGLKPAGTSNYFQPVKFTVTQIVEKDSSLSVVKAGQVTPLVLGDDAALGVRAGLAPKFEGEAVFCGYCLVIPEYKIDDLAGLDLKGKVVVYLSGGPLPQVPSELRAHYSSGGERAAAFRRAGVVGTVTIANPKSMDIPWERPTPARLNATMGLADNGDSHSQMIFSARINPASRQQGTVFASGHTFEELLALADRRRSPCRISHLNLSFRATETLTSSQVESPNVVGIYPGADPKLKDQYLVFSAHLDHLGIGGEINGDSIYNGAMDDGSGIASILEIAAMLKEQKIKLRLQRYLHGRRGGEKGELGSRYFATHPTVPEKNIVADLNLDMFLPRRFPLTIFGGPGRERVDAGNRHSRSRQKRPV